MTVAEPSVGSPGMSDAPAADAGVPAAEGDRVPWWVVVLGAVVLTVPLVIAVVQMREPTWRPVLDLAMTELRVRDVGTTETPLIGLPGRITTDPLEGQGSHPGPLSFYALAPTYRLLGSTAWAMLAGTAVIHFAAVLVALALARRRGGILLVAGVWLGLATLMLGYGAGALIEPWNPYLPMLWWVVLLLAVWSVLCDDLIGLPIAVAAGSFCAQTHVPYLALAVGMGALALGWAIVRAWRGGEGAPDRRSLVRWAGIAAGLGVLLWLAPTIDQIDGTGNYGKLIEHFTNPPEEAVGLRAALDDTFDRLDLWHLGSHQLTDPGLLVEGSSTRQPSATRGLVLLGAWAVAAVVAVRSVRERRLVALHAVAGAGLLLGYLSISRIFGLTWYYLMLWMWAVAVLLTIATVWTAAAWWVRRRPLPERARPALAVGALAAIGLVLVGRSAFDARSAEPSDMELSIVLDAVVDPTIDALEAGEGPATGYEGTYIVQWTDALHIGSQAYGLLNELDRAGFDAGLDPHFRVPATEHRVMEPGEATARVELVTGRYIEEWRARDDAVEVAAVDLRTPDDLERFDELRALVEEDLRAAGLQELIPRLDDNLFGVGVDPRVADVVRRRIDEMLHIGLPTSVFVTVP